ncbi:MAG: Spo0E family sporulation regulatory protein-aspartic acid phosphatase [Firmicutes bacterium]|nr:Spo0E family sporulation regulatory protein-aspartic acid phosphatase [Bacillota bacterium]
MNYLKKEKNMLAHIEKLREQLNKKINVKTNTPYRCSTTYAISKKLDKLIFQYMKKQ